MIIHILLNNAYISTSSLRRIDVVLTLNVIGILLLVLIPALETTFLLTKAKY